MTHLTETRATSKPLCCTIPSAEGDQRPNSDRKNVLILVDELKAAGAEILAVNMAIGLQASKHYRPVVCATRIGGELEDKLKENRIKYFLLHRSKPYHVQKLGFLKQIIREQRISIIHAHKSGSSLWGGLFGKLGKVDAIFAHIHGRKPDWKSSIAEKYLAKLCDKIITVSDFEKRRLIDEQRIDPSKIITVYNGIRVSKYRTNINYSLKNDFGIKADVPVIGIVAELRPEKNHDAFLFAAKALLKSRRDIHFLIVGDGARRHELEGQVANLGIASHCTFTGFIRNVPDVLSIVDVGVLCSQREALPLTLLEYMASSKPIVATTVGGIPEVIKDGHNGFLVQSGDHLALAEKIDCLLDNKQMASRMGSEGLSMVKQKYSEEKMIQTIEELYDQEASPQNIRLGLC